MADALGFLGTKKQIQILDGCPNNEKFFDDVEKQDIEIDKITIIGERNSGTTFLRKEIMRCFPEMQRPSS